MKANGTNQPLAGDLEPYRRLVELQKEIARLAEQNARANQKCAELRNKVANKVLKPSASRQKAGHNVNQTLADFPAAVIRSNLV